MKKLLCVLAVILCMLLIAGTACAEDITDSTDDFMENITSYDEQERTAEEKRLEEERRQAEEEQQKKEEQERQAAEKLEMIERQKAAEQARRTRDLTIALIIILGLTLVLFAVAAVLMLRQNRRFKKSLKK